VKALNTAGLTAFPIAFPLILPDLALNEAQTSTNSLEY
jgi:hypothetical protein